MKQALITAVAILIAITPSITCWLKEKALRKKSEKRLREAQEETIKQQKIMFDEAQRQSLM